MFGVFRIEVPSRGEERDDITRCGVNRFGVALPRRVNVEAVEFSGGIDIRRSCLNKYLAMTLPQPHQGDQVTVDVLEPGNSLKTSLF
jgi:hypothetical protein